MTRFFAFSLTTIGLILFVVDAAQGTLFQSKKQKAAWSEQKDRIVKHAMADENRRIRQSLDANQRKLEAQFQARPWNTRN